MVVIPWRVELVTFFIPDVPFGSSVREEVSFSSFIPRVFYSRNQITNFDGFKVEVVQVTENCGVLVCGRTSVNCGG